MKTPAPLSSTPSTPRIARVRVSRERLLRRLGLLSPCTVVVAPDGTGKTTLLAEWAHRLTTRGMEVRWVRGDELDEDTVDAALASVTTDLAVFVDDADLAEDATVHRLLTSMPQHPSLFVIMSASRALTVDAAMPDAERIDGRDLMLTIDETVQLGDLLGIDRERILALRAALGGWVGPLCAAALSGIPLDHTDAASIDARIERALVSAFGEERLSLVAASIDAPSPPLAADLRRDLVRAGLSDRNPISAERIELLPVVVESLRSRSGHPGSATWRALSSGSAGGTPAESLLARLRTAVAAAEWDDVESIWAQGGEDLLEHRVGETWRTLAVIPAPVLTAHPLLDGAVASTRRALGAGRALAAEAEPIPQIVEDPLDVRHLHVLARRIENAGRDGRTRAAERDARRLQQAIANTGSLLAPLTRARYQHATGSALLSRAQPTVGPGLLELDRAYETAVSGGSSTAASRISVEAALTLGFIGMLPDARLWADRITERSAADPGPALVTALLALESGDISTSERALTPVLEETQRDWRYWAFAMWVAARLSIASRAPLSGVALLEHASRRHASHLHASRLNRALIDRALADCAVSASHSTLAASLIDESDTPHIHAVPIARMQLLAGRFRAAVRTADAFEWHEHLLPRDRVELAGIRTDALYRLDKLDDAAGSFRQMLEYATATALITPLGLLDAATTAWLRESGRWPTGHPFDGISPLDWYGMGDGANPLSRRETVVIQRLARGARNEDIAEELTVSVNTVKSQLRSAYRKLGVTTRSDAVLRARELGILLSS